MNTIMLNCFFKPLAYVLYFLNLLLRNIKKVIKDTLYIFGLGKLPNAIRRVLGSRVAMLYYGIIILAVSLYGLNYMLFFL